MAKSMAFQFAEGVLIAVHPASDPSDEDWAAYVQFCKQLPKSCRKTLAMTKGGGPNPKQRKVLQEEYLKHFVHDKANPMKVAVITDSPLLRGVVTALNWFNPNTVAFAPSALEEAFRYLGVPAGASSAKLALELRKLEKEIAP